MLENYYEYVASEYSSFTVLSRTPHPYKKVDLSPFTGKRLLPYMEATKPSVYHDIIIWLIIIHSERIVETNKSSKTTYKAYCWSLTSKMHVLCSDSPSVCHFRFEMLSNNCHLTHFWRARTNDLVKAGEGMWPSDVQCHCAVDTLHSDPVPWHLIHESSHASSKWDHETLWDCWPGQWTTENHNIWPHTPPC